LAERERRRQEELVEQRRTAEARFRERELRQTRKALGLVVLFSLVGRAKPRPARLRLWILRLPVWVWLLWKYQEAATGKIENEPNSRG
jgi:hypothetical protein